MTPVTENGHWQYPVNIDHLAWFGFIYRIVEIDTGREYIGKKQLKSYTKKKVKGRKNKKSVIKESDWKKYTGSSKSLNERIEETGMDNYAFFIESLHDTRGSLVYAEVSKQISEDVLRTISDDGIIPKYYNRQIGGVKFIPAAESISEHHANIGNYTVSKTKTVVTEDVTPGLSYDDYYGEKRVTKFKKKLTKYLKENT